MSDIYGKANYAQLHNVPQLKWENINPINDYIATAMAQAQLDTEKARVEAFKENMALDRDRFEYTKSNDAILNAMKEKELALDTRKEDREDYQFNNLSANQQAQLDIKKAEMLSNERVAGITASAKSSGGNGNGNIQRDWNAESSILANLDNKEFVNALKAENITPEEFRKLRDTNYIEYLVKGITILKKIQG